MPTTRDDALLEQLALTARLLGARRIVLRGRCNAEWALWCRLLDAGARSSRHVIAYDDERPHVIERAELMISDLVIEAHAPPRPASPGERAALDSDQAFFCIDSCRVVEMTHVD